MEQLISHYGIRPGDKVSRRKVGFPLITHYGIYLGQNHLGQYLFAENTAERGVVISAAQQFFNSVTNISVHRFHGSENARNLAVQQAIASSGQKYSLLTNNCEHFANRIHKGQPQSNQVTWGIGITAILALFALAK